MITSKPPSDIVNNDLKECHAHDTTISKESAPRLSTRIKPTTNFSEINHRDFRYSVEEVKDIVKRAEVGKEEASKEIKKIYKVVMK